jgi:hypothetical protein
MVLASRSTTMRKAGAFLALVAFEVGAVVVLHRLGELPWLRIPVDDLAGWLQTSAPEDVLAAAVRLVALGAAWWLLGSTALYVLARLSRIPGAISALERVTLPSVRRLADQAIALTLAGSIIGGGANAALASPAGIPSRPDAVVAAHDPLSAWGRASTLGYRPAPGTTEPPAYQPEAAGHGQPGYRPEAAGRGEKPSYQPRPAGRSAEAAPDAGSATTSPPRPSPSTSSTRPSPTSSPRPPTSSTGPAPTTSSPSSPPSTASPPTSRPALAKGSPAPTAPRGAAPSTTTKPPAPRYTPSPAGPPRPRETPPSETGLHHVALGDNLWTIARDRLATVTRRPAAELGEREIARYWLEVVDANRASLRSGDPDLIFPGELIKLPPVTGHEP